MESFCDYKLIQGKKFFELAL